MAEIVPFRAYRYDARRVALPDVLTQPYDKITPEMQQRYYSLSPYNLIPVEKGRALPGDNGSNVYTRAAQALDSWIRDGILVRELAPAIYVYAQQFSVPGSGEARTRRGFIALGPVVDYSAGVVHRHEQTLAGPRADRLALLRHTRAHTGQLFMLYTDPQQQVDSLLDCATPAPAPVSFRDEFGVTHHLWPITDPGAVQQIVSAMRDKKLVIADGHHRYETAVAFRDECRAAGAPAGGPHGRVMMTFVNSASEGLAILPTHRVIANLPAFAPDELLSRLAAWFDARAVAGGIATAQRELLAARTSRGIGLYVAGAFHLLTLKPQADLAALIPGASAAQRQLDVVLLHRLILEKGMGISAEAVSRESHIRYERMLEGVVSAVDRGEAQCGFLLNAVSVQTVMEMALAGEVLPQKSTDFYPKLLSGLTIYKLD
jgi:uncharacterized protein (DUF1015 family)